MFGIQMFYPDKQLCSADVSVTFFPCKTSFVNTCTVVNIVSDHCGMQIQTCTNENQWSVGSKPWETKINM